MTNKTSKIAIFCLILSIQLKTNFAFGREYITIAGSSTVFPFARTIAEEFGRNTNFKTPIVESNGTGSGIKLFCLGVGDNFIDFANASRKIEPSEINFCHQNGVRNIVEITIGYDGIVLASSIQTQSYNLTKEQIFLALADKIPLNGKLVKNPYKKWSEINKSLPDREITFYGAPSTSGTRDALSELVMEEPCINKKEFINQFSDLASRKKNCHIIRSDGHFIEVGENGNLIIQKLRNNQGSIGIVGFSFLGQNSDIIKGAKIEGIYPTFENISSKKYKVSRPLLIYFKKEQLPLVRGMKEFIMEIIDENTIGEEGYLIEKGLIPAHRDDIKKMRKEILGGL